MQKEPFYDARLGDALKLAADAFAHVPRKGTGIPYLSHLLAVSTMVMEHGGTPDQCIAAVLHDYLEDIHGASEVHLQERFGDNVALLVRALSDTTQAEHKEPWLERKQRYIAHLRTTSGEVRLICCADKIHNARSLLRDRRVLGDALFERFHATKEQTFWYYEEVVKALGEGWSHGLLEELERDVNELVRG
jgi:(p)ppGpp synthase/HD superfamily hydrolase